MASAAEERNKELRENLSQLEAYQKAVRIVTGMPPPLAQTMLDRITAGSANDDETMLDRIPTSPADDDEVMAAIQWKLFCHQTKSRK